MKGGPRFSLRARGTVLTSRILKVRERCRLALSARVPWKKKKGGGKEQAQCKFVKWEQGAAASRDAFPSNPSPLSHPPSLMWPTRSPIPRRDVIVVANRSAHWRLL